MRVCNGVLWIQEHLETQSALRDVLLVLRVVPSVLCIRDFPIKTGLFPSKVDGMEVFTNNLFEVEICATQNHLSKIVETVLSSEIRSLCGCGVYLKICDADDFETLELMKHRRHEWTPFLSHMHDASIFWNDGIPLGISNRPIDTIIDGVLQTHPQRFAKIHCPHWNGTVN